MTGAELLLKTAHAAGVDTCFANPGTTEMGMVAAFDKVKGLKPVLCLFEGVCTGMADGYARMTGKPGMTLLHLGVGLGNGVANLHNARRAWSPIVNIVGDHPKDHLPYDAPLTSDIESIARGVSHEVVRLTEGEDFDSQCGALFADRQGKKGQIRTAILPSDVADATCTDKVSRFSVSFTNYPHAFDDRMQSFKNGKKTALLLGGDGLHEEGLKQAARMAQVSGCTLLAEAFAARWDRGAGLPMARRLPYFPEAVTKLLSEFEQLVLAGTKEPVAFFKYPELPSTVVPDTCKVFSLCKEDEHPADWLEALADALGAPKNGYPVTEASRPDAPTGKLDTKSVGAAVAATLPENAIISDESATSGAPAFFQTVSAPRHSSMHLTGGGIGMGMPVASGAAVACADRPVLNLQADGSGMYTLQSLWTQAREGLNVTTLIFSNRSYAILNVELARAGIESPGPRAASLTDLSNPDIDWVRMAGGMGVPGTRPESAEELVNALERAYAEPGPHLIEVVI